MEMDWKQSLLLILSWLINPVLTEGDDRAKQANI